MRAGSAMLAVRCEADYPPSFPDFILHSTSRCVLAEAIVAAAMRMFDPFLVSMRPNTCTCLVAVAWDGSQDDTNNLQATTHLPIQFPLMWT